MLRLFLLICFILFTALSPKKSGNEIRSELRNYIDAEETKNETLLQYIESMLIITRSKISFYRGNKDQLESINEILARVKIDIDSLDKKNLSLNQRVVLSKLDIEHKRQSFVLSELVQRYRQQVTLEQSA